MVRANNDVVETKSDGVHVDPNLPRPLPSVKPRWFRPTPDGATVDRSKMCRRPVSHLSDAVTPSAFLVQARVANVTF